MLSEREIKLQVVGEPSSRHDAFLDIFPRHVWVEDGYSGTVDLIAEAPGVSGFPSGAMTIAKVIDIKDEVNIAVSSTNSFNENDEIIICVTEATAGSLNAKNESLKLKLPSGFAWSNVNSGYAVWLTCA